MNKPTIPLSPALTEADPMSLNLLFSLDPESLEFRDAIPLMVRTFRAQAERFMELEAKGKKGKNAKASPPAIGLGEGTSEELGF